MKKRKTFISFILAFALCLGLTGCGMAQELANSYNTKELSDEEVVLAFMEAYQQGDYEAMKPYISEDNPLHLFFRGPVRRHGRRLNRPGGKRNHCLPPNAGLDCQRH